MAKAEASDAARLQEQQAKIDRVAAELVRLLRVGVTEQRYGELTVSVPLRGGLLETARFDPAFSLKL